MAVQVWIGEKPEHPNERRAILALANGLDRLEGLYLILANFSVGGLNIDLVICKQDAVFIIELKHCDGKVFGDVNGPWYVESANGERKRLNPGRKNPYNQVIAYFYRLTNFLNDHRPDLLSAHKAETVNFRTCKRLVVIAPTIQEGSAISLDWKVELKGLDELPAYLVTERSSEIDLTEQEMQAIPQLLNCTRWKEINDLVNGAQPLWEAAPALPEEAVPAAVEVAPPPQPELPVAPPPPLTFWQRTRAALGTTTGRVAAGMTALAALLLLALALLLPGRAARTAVQPVPPLIVSTSPAAGGVTGGGGVRPAACIWNGYQSVGKRWDGQLQDWATVTPGDPTAPPPDLVLTLEQVNFCSSQITLTWSLRNNGTAPVNLPLNGAAINLQDGLGNSYQLADDQSRPQELRVEPGKQARGTAVVLQPISQSAITLKVTLKTESFGGAIWLVCLDGCG